MLFCFIMLTNLSGPAARYCASRGVSLYTAQYFGLGQSDCGAYLLIPVRNQNGNELFIARRNIFIKNHTGRYSYVGDVDRRAIFGIDKIKSSEKRIILVEGYFDVMVAYENGYENVVANIGCTTVGQPWWEFKASMLASMFSRVDIAFDGFPGGHPQQKEAVADFCRRGILSSEIILPTGIDPAMLSKDQMAMYFGNHE